MTVSTLAPRARRKMKPAEPPDAVTQYALDVVAGRIVAGILVRKACERHLADLATGHERGLVFDRAAAEKAIAFFPLLRHYKGEWGPRPEVPLGDPIVLEGWQCFAIGSLFGWKRANGTRRFRQFYLEVAKKNGKTLMAAGIAVLLAFFDGEAGAEVYAIASKRDQAKLVWNDASVMVSKNASLRRRIREAYLTLSHAASASFFRPLGRDSGESEQGVNAHGYIVDELHILEDRESIDNIRTATSARRQPVGVMITTAGVSRESVWAEERADAVSVVEGRATDDSMLVLVYTLDEGDDPFDEAVWPKANPNLGVSVPLEFLREESAKAQRSPGFMSAFLRFHANIPTSVSTRAISIEEWDACTGLLEGEDYHAWEARTFGDPKRPRSGYAGLDLSATQDLTAFIFVVADEEDQERFDVLCRFYCPEEGIVERSRRGVPYDEWARDGFLVATPGNVIDHDFIEHDILELGARHTIGEVGFDAWNSGMLPSRLMEQGVGMMQIPQRHSGLAPGFREIQTGILERRWRHGGHPILRWMAGNVESEIDSAGNEKPSKLRSAEKIDGIVGFAMAMNRWLAYGQAPAVWTAA